MGNSQNQHPSKGSVDEWVQSDPCAIQRQRLLNGFQTWSKRTNISEQLRRSDFKADLFGSYPDYGDKVFSFMAGVDDEGSKQENQITSSKYIEKGLTLLMPTTSQHELYFNIFSGGKKVLNKEDTEAMLNICHDIAWKCTGTFNENPASNTRTIQAVVNSMFGKSAEISQSDMTYWCGRHCRQLYDSIHQITCAVLLGDNSLFSQGAAGTSVEQLQSELAEHVAVGLGPLNSASLWLLTTSLPVSFFPSADGAASASATLNLPLLQVCSPAGWHLLYDSNEQGLSVNRYQHHVFEYKGATLTFITFTGHTYCVVADSEWREGRQRFGGSDCMLIQMLPKYTVMQAGAGMLYVNFSDRTAPQGLQVGKDARTTFLSIDNGLSKVTHYGVETDLHQLQVWGCAGLLTREAQQRQKDWDKRQAQKSKDRKIKLDDWENNPDRQILEMGGVTTEHAQR